MNSRLLGVKLSPITYIYIYVFLIWCASDRPLLFRNNLFFSFFFFFSIFFAMNFVKLQCKVCNFVTLSYVSSNVCLWTVMLSCRHATKIELQKYNHEERLNIKYVSQFFFRTKNLDLNFLSCQKAKLCHLFDVYAFILLPLYRG